MAYSASHGPPALDATHQWAPATGSAPPVLGDTHVEPMELPQIVITNIASWRGRAEIIDNRAGRTYGSGEVVYPERRIGKTLVYTCRLQADDREEFMLNQNAIVQGFSDGDEGVMTVTPWPVPGGVVWTYIAKVLDLGEDTNWELDGERQVTYEWPFTLTLRMSSGLFITSGVGYA